MAILFGQRGRSPVPLLLLAVALATACGTPPVAPPPSQAPTEPSQAAFDSLRAWFAERGVPLPEQLPPPEEAAKPALDRPPLLGDVTGNWRVTLWDLWPLWDHLTRYRLRPAGYYDMDLVDIDRDGDNDWRDLMLLGQHIFERQDDEPNPYGIGLPIPYGTFDIELVFVPGHRLTSEQMQLMRDAARRWEAIITADVSGWYYSPDYPERTSDMDGWDDYWGDADGELDLLADDRIDDVRVFVTTRPGMWPSSGGPFLWDGHKNLPFMGLVKISEFDLDLQEEELLSTMIHELGHVLGLGTLWDDQDLIRDLGEDTYFIGAEARRYFDLAGGFRYRGNKVPVQIIGHHWREAVFGDEIMSPFSADGHEPLSLVTIGALEDMGYRVDITRADPYALPREALSKPVATSRRRCEVLRPPHRGEK